MTESILELIQDELHDRMHSIYERHFYSKIEVPSALYHYTSINGLFGIIRESAFWASEFSFFRDPSEVTFGASVASNCLRDLVKKQESDTSARILQNVIAQYDQVEHSEQMRLEDLYIISFSEENDLLSQWISYGDNGRGACIGFDLKKTNAIYSRSADRPFTTRAFVPITYDDRMQIQFINDIVADVIDAIIEIRGRYGDGIDSEKDVVVDMYVAYLSAALKIARYLIKHSAFKEEAEWRLIQTRRANLVPGVEGVKFRTSESKLIPYITIDFSRDDKPGCLPIASVKLGPKSHHGNRRSVIKLLTSLDYDFFKVYDLIEYSKIPFE